MILEYLPWDSSFFNKKTGKIIFSINDETQLKLLLKQAILDGYQLLYLFGDENIFLNREISNEFNGTLIDQKILYTKSIVEADLKESIAIEYTSEEITSELENLTYLSGVHSRFRLDSNFQADDFYRLYKKWITKSISHKIADYVFVIKENELIMGMVTLIIKDSIGEIGLIAVSESVQGKGYGKDLINKCINQLISIGICQINVTTQIENLSACRFYKSCGFEKKSLTNIYHFWL